MVRQDGRPADRPEPALRHPPRARPLRRAAGRRGRAGRGAAPRPERGGHARHGPRRAHPADRPLLGPRRRRAGRLPRRAGQRSSAPTRSSPRSCPFTDAKLERDYLFCQGAVVLHPGRRRRRHRPRQRGRARLPQARPDLRGIRLARPPTRERSPRSSVVPASSSRARRGAALGHHRPLNERFGTNFDPEDRYFYDAIADKLAGRPDMQQAAAANSPENFKLVLEKEFLSRRRRPARRRPRTWRSSTSTTPRCRAWCSRLTSRSSRARPRSPTRSTAPSANSSAPTASRPPSSTRRRCAPTPTTARCSSRSRPRRSRRSPRS